MRYTIDEMHFRGFKQQKLNWKQAISQGLELSGTIIAFTYALRFAWHTKFVILILACFVLWLIYITNKISDHE